MARWRYLIVVTDGALQAVDPPPPSIPPLSYAQVVLRYLIVVTGMAPYKLLNHTKRVIVNLGRSKADRLVEELVAELHLVETINVNVERTETPPFFR